jgi:hypothetical protein
MGMDERTREGSWSWVIVAWLITGEYCGEYMLVLNDPETRLWPSLTSVTKRFMRPARNQLRLIDTDGDISVLEGDSHQACGAWIEAKG